MSQKSVEVLIGKLVTDESFRLKFSRSPSVAIQELQGLGLEFTPVEVEALRSLPVGPCQMLARHLDPRIRRIPTGRAEHGA